MASDSTVAASLPREASLSARPAANRWLKLVVCLCFLLIAVALLLIERHSPATGYELSIYSSLPPAAWVCLIGALAGGTVIIVHQAFARREGRYWLLGFSLLILTTSIILLLPVFRDYYLYSAEDTRTHINLTEQMLNTGHFRPDNKYPITHILIGQLALAAGVAPLEVVKHVPVLFTVLFMLFSYLLATSVLPQRRQAVLAAATTPLFFNYYHVCTYPQALAMMIMPLIFYLYFKGFIGASLLFRVAFVTLLLLFPYFHPAPAAALIVCLLAAEGAKAAWRAKEARTAVPTDTPTYAFTFGPALICGVAFLTWISSFYLFTKTVYNILRWLVGEIESVPRVTEVEQAFSSQGIDLGGQLALGVKLYGDNIIYLALSGIALLLVLLGFLRNDARVRNLSILAMPFLVSGPVWVLIFAATLLVTLGRLLGANIMMWATPVLAAFALVEILGRWRRVRVALITAVLLLASVSSVAAVYHSPFVLQPSWQVTWHDVHGTRWFRDRAALAERGIFANLGIPRAWANGRVEVPDHFGYATNDRLGQWLPIDLFVLTGERFHLGTSDPVLSRTVVSNPSLARPGFTTTDFQQLTLDGSVQRLYSNGELDVFFVRTEG